MKRKDISSTKLLPIPDVIGSCAINNEQRACLGISYDDSLKIAGAFVIAFIVNRFRKEAKLAIINIYCSTGRNSCLFYRMHVNWQTEARNSSLFYCL
jgi:hypothetical protein